MKVFLSYARKDVALAERLEKDLKNAEIDVWRDLHEIQGGDDWENEIRSGICAADSVVYLGTPDARASGVVRGELTFAKAYNKPIHPVFALGKSWADVAPLVLIPKQYFDLRQEHYTDGLAQLVARIKGLIIKPPPIKPLPIEPFWRIVMRMLFANLRKRLHTTGVSRDKKRLSALAVPAGGLRNPYKGLRPFTSEDAEDFFGRKEVIDQAVGEIRYILTIEQRDDRRQEPRFVSVIGPSGSGKSSMVMAGLLPRLQKGQDIPGSHLWTLLPAICPGRKPLEALAQALSQALPGKAGRDEILSKLADRSTCALHSYACEIAGQPGRRVVLFVDQFEELFTETAEREEREQFIHQLVTAATEPENKVIVIITLRVDFSDYPMHYSLLHNMIEAHRIAIPPMTVENLRDVIEGPAKRPGVGLQFEENLVGDLLFDIHGQEENLPLLQFTLAKLFEQRSGNYLTRRAYETIGGVRGALNQHAEETYNSLPSDEHRRLAEVLFTRLINPGGLGQDATRRRVLSSELTFHDATQNDLMEEVIRIFVDRARLITANWITADRGASADTGAQSSEGASIYEMSHEALISAWARLTDWINLAREDILMRQTLGNDRERWENQNRDQKQLYAGHRLKEAEEWAKRATPTKQEEEFLHASERYQRTKNARLSTYFGLPALLVVIIAGLWGPYFYYHFLSPTTVTNLQDSGSGSLRQVIHDASPGSKITFDPSLNGTILLRNADLNIAKDLTIQGPRDQQNTIQIHISNGGKSGARVHIVAGASVEFMNIAFQNSHVLGTAFLENEGKLTLDSCLVSNNRAEAQINGGGGITNLNGELIIMHSVISGNVAERNGGGIYSWEGPLTLNNSVIENNAAGNDGGGIYELRGRLTLSNDTHVLNNTTKSSDATSNGGGISVLNGTLILDSSKIRGNHTQGYGGGLTLLGATALIDNSIITENQAGSKGGGLAVEKNSESTFDSLATITNMEVMIANEPKTSYFIWGNTSPQQASADILGVIKSLPPLVTVDDDSTESTGSPAPKNPPEKGSHFLGTINLDTYCHAQYPNQAVSLKLVNSEDILCEKLDNTKVTAHMSILPEKVCQAQYSGYSLSDGIARLTDYYDPSSWQCYKHVTKLGGITKYLDTYCHNVKGYAGATPLPAHPTAYDWSCQGTDNQPQSIAITDACQWKYPPYGTSAFDVLANFNDPNGWECWAPKP